MPIQVSITLMRKLFNDLFKNLSLKRIELNPTNNTTQRLMDAAKKVKVQLSSLNDYY